MLSDLLSQVGPNENVPVMCDSVMCDSVTELEQCLPEGAVLTAQTNTSLAIGHLGGPALLG